MSRGLSADVIAMLEARQIRIGELFVGQFASITLRLWTGNFNLSWNNQTYYGNGWLHDIRNYSEDAENDGGESIKVVLSGVPVELISLALNEAQQSYTGECSFVLFDEDWQPAHEEKLFRGNLDTVDINEDPTHPEILISYRDRDARSNTPRESRWTVEDQRWRTGQLDKGFDYVPFLTNQRLYWGRPDATRTGK